MINVVESLVVIGMIVFFSWVVVNHCASREYVAKCILGNSKLLNVEEICESKWRLK